MVEKPLAEESRPENAARRVRQIRGPQTEPRLDLRESLAILRRSKLSILAITALVTGLTLLVSSRQTPVYESEARLLLKAVDIAGDPSTAADPNLSTEAELVSSVAVAEIVSENLAIDRNPRQLLDDLSVGRPSDTEILDISYRHTDPAEAQRRAQGFAEGYLEYRRGTVLEEVLESTEAIQEEISALTERLRVVERNLVNLPEDDPRRTTLESEASLLRQLILQSQLDELDLPERISVGEIVESAPRPVSPVSPNHVVNGSLGLAAGLALAVGLAFLRDRLSGRLRSPDEVEETFGAPVLGSIPQVPGWRRRKEPYLVTLKRPSPAGEAYRILRTGVLSAATLYDANSIMVTSPHSGEGKSATVANLAVVLARAGKRVSLVSADLRRPRLHQFFGVNARIGLADVLTGRATLDQALQEITLATSPWVELSAVRLRILPSGPIPDDPAELLTSETMSRVVRTLEETSDIVLIDVPPMLPVTDALVVAQVAQGVLTVFGPRSVNRSSVLSAQQELEKVGARILGCVLNGPHATFTRADYSY